MALFFLYLNAFTFFLSYFVILEKCLHATQNKFLKYAEILLFVSILRFYYSGNKIVL